jgi:cell division protein FtsZ
MVFITCGMGGGTGTGASSVVAKIAKEIGALVIAIVTRPFSFEGTQRRDIAERGLADLKREVDAFIVIPNDKLLAIVDGKVSAKNAFAMCDEILRQAVEGVSDIITTSGDINTDFNDIKAIMEGAGPALMGIGVADGDDRAREAAQKAINSPLLDVSIGGAKGVLFVVAGAEDLGLLEVQEAATIIRESVDSSAKIIFGIMRDEKLKKGQIRIIVIATGFPESEAHSTSHASPVERSLFTMAAESREEERGGGRIFHEILKREEKAPVIIEEIREVPLPEVKEVKPKHEVKKDIVPPAERDLPIVTAQPRKPQQEDTLVMMSEDDEAWGAIPAFLRRHKK